MPGREQAKDAIKILTATGRNRGCMDHWRYFAYLRPFCLHPLRVPQAIPGKENTMESRNRELKAVVVRPEEYPQVAVIEDVSAWFISSSPVNRIWTNSDVPKTDKRDYMDNEISTLVESWYV